MPLCSINSGSIIFPSFPDIRSLTACLKSSKLSELILTIFPLSISPGVSINVKYSLIGHSERKQNFNENLKDLSDKIQNVIEEDII